MIKKRQFSNTAKTPNNSWRRECGSAAENCWVKKLGSYFEIFPKTSCLFELYHFSWWKKAKWKGLEKEVKIFAGNWENCWREIEKLLSCGWNWMKTAENVCQMMDRNLGTHWMVGQCPRHCVFASPMMSICSPRQWSSAHAPEAGNSSIWHFVETRLK